MLSFFTVRKCYHFCVIIFPCSCWVLSFMLSFYVILFCYHFPPFLFFLKTWHTPIKAAGIAGDGPVPGSEGHVVQDLEPGGEQRRGRRHGRRLHTRLGLWRHQRVNGRFFNIAFEKYKIKYKTNVFYKLILRFSDLFVSLPPVFLAPDCLPASLPARQSASLPTCQPAYHTI